MRIRRVGPLLVAVAAAALGSLGAGPPPLPSPTAPPAPAAGPLEAEVAGVVVDTQTRQPLLVLRAKRDKRPLLLAIGQLEAERIAILLQGVTPPRPLTHDLILTLLGEVKASLARIVITDLRDDVYYALLYLDVGGGVVTVDARPSDAIALALRARVPILVEERVFEKSERQMPKPSPSPHF